jgi:hypothetical protein
VCQRCECETTFHTHLQTEVGGLGDLVLAQPQARCLAALILATAAAPPVPAQAACYSRRC